MHQYRVYRGLLPCTLASIASPRARIPFDKGLAPIIVPNLRFHAPIDVVHTVTLCNLFSIGRLFDLVNANNPMIARKRLLQVLQLKVLVPYFVMTNTIKARRDMRRCPNL